MPTAALLLFAFIMPLVAQEKWPATFQAPQPKLQPLPDKEEASAWETTHFILLSESDLSPQQLLNFARVIESVPQLLKSLPLPLWAPPQGPKIEIRICQNETSFVARGGPLGAAGYYNGRQALALVRGDLLLAPPQASPANSALSPEGDLLIHELCHLAMHRYHGLPPWLLEGMAEYFASCHLGKGRYKFTESTRTIQQHIRKFYPQEQFPILALPPLSKMANLTSKEWISENKMAPPEDRYRPYAAALLMTHYYVEGGTKRRNELARFLQQRLEPDQNEEENLLAKVPADLEDKLTLFWKSKGLSIRFENP